MRVLELCAGGGGQAIGLEAAGFEAAGLIEIDKHACETLSINRPKWNVINADLKDIDPVLFKGVEMVCGGVPCQPFSIAGKGEGHLDSRDCFPFALEFVASIRPVAFFFENVRGLATPKFDTYRNALIEKFNNLGYYTEWRVIEAADYRVPQLRPRFILVGRRDARIQFPWPAAHPTQITVADTIGDLLGANGWLQLGEWKKSAEKIAPTIVGGSKKHGGPDLGPTRAKRQWAELGIDGMGIANDAPSRDFLGSPKLTNRMVARIQGFPDNWQFVGGKTSIYRQIGNALPPPVAKEVGLAMVEWLKMKSTSQKRSSKIFKSEVLTNLRT